MEYRKIGGSSLTVSCLALGGNIFGRFCDRMQTAELMSAAREFGINMVDTADVYSDGLSEEWIGQALQGCRNRWIIATKVGVSSGGSPLGKGRREQVFACAEQSLRRLRTDYIDLYQMHHFDEQTPMEETLEALSRLLRQGKIRCAGVCNYSGDQLRNFLQLARELNPLSVASIQSAYNLLKRRVEDEIFPLCREENVGFLAYGVLGRGVLARAVPVAGETAVPPPGTRAASSASIGRDLTGEVLRAVRALSSYAEGRGRTIAQLALAWSLRRPELASVLTGVRDRAHLETDVAATQWRLTEDDLKEIDALVGDLSAYRSVSLGSFS